MSNINDVLPETIKTAEQAKEWLLVHGYSEDLAKEEVANWTAPEFEDADEEDLEEELEWEDDEEEEDDEVVVGWDTDES